MAINYSSTRGGENNVTASMAILKGLAADGGLFMPDHIPALDCSLEELSHKTYQEVAYAVMKQFLTDFTEEELKTCIERAYDSKFDTEEIAPLVKADGAYYLELFHGSTIAFKDMALSILPHLMIVSAKKNHAENTIVILTATSGDTGKAAMAGFADVEGTRIIVFYPKDGVSRVQELQMLTQKGANTSVVGISGNFDDAQSGVKKIFGDKEFAKELAGRGYQLSSANSINIGRLVPQVVYYVYAYAKLLENGEIVGTFALFLGEDESYRVIEDGAWHLDQPYGTIHRLASNGKARGVSKACFDFCTAQIGYLRADTHADNRPMQRLLEAYGFRRCGVIHGAFDGGERIAYDCIAHI